MGLFNFLKKKGKEEVSSSDTEKPSGKEEDPFASLGEGLPPLPPMPDVGGEPSKSMDSFGDLPPIRAPDSMQADTQQMAQPSSIPETGETQSPTEQSGGSSSLPPAPELPPQAPLPEASAPTASGTPSDIPPMPESAPGFMKKESLTGEMPPGEIAAATQGPAKGQADEGGFPSDEELMKESSNIQQSAAPAQPAPPQFPKDNLNESGFKMFPDKPMQPEVRDFASIPEEGGAEDSKETKMFPDTFATKTDDVGSFMAGRQAENIFSSRPTIHRESEEHLAMPPPPKPSIPTLAVRDESLRGKPLFIRADLYASSLKDVDDVKRILREAEESLMRAKDVREQIDKQYQKWHDALEDIQRRLVYVDQKLFE